MKLKALSLCAASLFLACGDDVPQAPQIQPDRSEIQFGGEFGEAVWVGTSVKATLQLVNGGLDDLQISGAAVEGTNAALFTAKLSTDTVATDKKAFVEVSYTPDSPGQHTAELVVTSNAENSPSLRVPLKATAVSPD